MDEFMSLIFLCPCPKIPNGYMACQGQKLSIANYNVLYSLIGTTFGGDGVSTFALPDLRGRIPVHQGNGFLLAENGGAEEITLTVNQIPAHAHPALATNNNGQQSGPGGLVLGRVTGSDIYGSDTPYANMAPNMISATGGSQPHNNFQPYLCVDFIISLFGIFPSPT